MAELFAAESSDEERLIGLDSELPSGFDIDCPNARRILRRGTEANIMQLT